jgi:DoxX-like family
MTTLSIGGPIVTTETTTYPPRLATSKGMLWTGRVLSTLIVLFMLMDGVMKLFKPHFVVEATTKLGYPESTIVPIGLAATLGAILYAIPQTAVLGAIILTGFLGGACATHVRAGESNWYFAVLFGVIAWLGLVLRDERLRDLLPIRRTR